MNLIKKVGQNIWDQGTQDIQEHGHFKQKAQMFFNPKEPQLFYLYPSLIKSTGETPPALAWGMENWDSFKASICCSSSRVQMDRVWERRPGEAGQVLTSGHSQECLPLPSYRKRTSICPPPLPEGLARKDQREPLERAGSHSG